MQTTYSYYTEDNFTSIGENEVFVFGSNLAGRHGLGAAKFARDRCGAKYGIGTGFTGNSYALPTKDQNLRVMSLVKIQAQIEHFKFVAQLHPDKVFLVTKIGCGLAGYKDHEIAPLFRGSPSNCKFHCSWRIYLQNSILR